MAKFPSQRKLHYKLEGIDDQTMTSLGLLNLPKDLSILNRRGYASTTRKGVPLIYRCKVDFYIHNYLGQLFDDDGTALASAYNADMQAVLKLAGTQNNWVFRNAAVKWHAAREAMFRNAGVKKAHRGAYSHEVRYNYHTADDSGNWLVPIDGDGAVFTGGTWDLSDISTDDDGSIALMLVGPSDFNEETAPTGSKLNIAHSYLVSRVNQLADTNPEAEEGPAEFSVLNQLLSTRYQDDTKKDEVIDEARNAQDNPPYEVLDLSDSADINHDISEAVELGRAIAGMGAAFGSVIVDIPFGLADCRGSITQHASQTDEPDGFMAVEVLDIFEMQG